jgi:hypothetical protein
MEDDNVATGLQPLQYYGCARQCGMPAERDLHSRCEPANPVVDAVSDDKGCLREVVLGSQRLQNGIFWVVVENHDCGRVPGEAAGGERVDVKKLGLHTVALTDAWTMLQRV